MYIQFFFYYVVENTANQLAGKPFDGITSNFLIRHDMYVVLIVLATVLSMEFFKKALCAYQKIQSSDLWDIL